MLFRSHVSLGCIQSMSCHTDKCPTGVATQDKSRQRALVVDDKAARVAQFHESTLEALAELIAAAGVIPAVICTDPHGPIRVSRLI